MLPILPFIAFLQDVPDVADKLFKVSPYDATAYGALVVVLFVFAYIQWKEKREDAKRLEKFVEVLQGVEIHMRQLDDIKQLLLIEKTTSPKP